MKLTTQELNALRKDTDSITFHDHKLFISAIKKLKSGTDKKLFSVCSVRLAISLNKGRIPNYEKANHWENAAARAKDANEPNCQLYNYAAQFYGKDLAHSKSAELFEKSAKSGATENIGNCGIQQLYRECRQQYDLAGNSMAAGRVFILENDCRLNESKGLEKIFLALYRALSLYGESPLRVAISALIVILVCALLYFLSGINSSEAKAVIHSFPSSLYFSVVTFTTLGYGDFSPANTFARVISSCQAISGLLLSSLFLVTIVRKYSR